jgi:transcription-repair coupling factor (superfamily II helicase)
LDLGGLLKAIRRSDEYHHTLQRLVESGGNGTAPPLTWELLEAARPAVIAALRTDWGGPILVLLPQPERARSLHEQVILWAGWSQAPAGEVAATPAWYFPAPDALFYDWTPWDGETIRRRITVLSALASNRRTQQPVIFASVWALMTVTVPPNTLRPGIQELGVGQTMRMSSFLEQLVAYAYEPVSVVEEPGTFSQRGGIIDVYPSNAPRPVRIEWFADEIDTIRTFDPVTQRSLQKRSEVCLYPASEALPRCGQAALRYLSDVASRQDSPASPRPQRDREHLEVGEYFKGMEFHLPSLYSQAATLLDYLPVNTLVLIDNLPGVDSAAKALEAQAIDLRTELTEEGRIAADFPAPYRPWSELCQSLASLTTLVLGYDVQVEDACIGELSDLDRTRRSPPSFHPAPRYGGRVQQLVEDSCRFKASGQRMVIVSRQAQRLSNWFEEAGQSVVPTSGVPELPATAGLTLIQGALAEGWQLGSASVGRDEVSSSILLLTDTEIFGWAKPRRRPYTRRKAASPESFFAELREGDYVVHIDHGIAVYRGLVQKTVDTAQREYLDLEYAEADRLYLPVSQIDRITRYVGASDQVPRIHRLGSADWSRVRAKAKRAVEDIAKELLQLYAARELVKGHAFAPDTAWQEELEASFLYEETPDQLQAVLEVKEDMERRSPMDRLLVGDVGYGKTEVAVRAAFKAVMDGKQVAVLVPTTVLAQQHLLTFQQRLAAFPVDVAMLSRFCSPREQRDIVERLMEGKADIVVGTHRLLQKDVSFKDLGLLVVDEEQRFGVRHKEWLKQMRQQIDVLTMTATPIPRTLYMSLSGVRDMSTIDTPPEERLPIRTAVSRYDEHLIRRAVLREMNRNGQVYFVHNRVQGIRQMAQRLQKIVPEASIAIGHGQMPEEKLSKVMLDFAAGMYDVLVCTSIIESGLDIPNVNTIVINRADHFGLAQLYQLRGRVGRSTVQAYAYLLYDKHRRLSDVARRRLEAILEASELGAGFRIAMRDLEIRGAGEILGARQHGHIAAVGFELYCRLLAQAVDELKAGGMEEQPPKPEIETPPLIELPLQAYLPDGYVPDEGLRLRMYQRLAALTREEELDDVRRELEDRFGILPTPAEDLLYVLRIRLLASRADVQAIGREDNNLVLKLGAQGQQRAKEIVTHFGRRAWVGRGQMWLALMEDQRDWRTLLVTLLVRLTGQRERDKERVER